jgi:hypothetical protein
VLFSHGEAATPKHNRKNADATRRYQELMERQGEFVEWCKTNLRGLYRIRTDVQASIYICTTLEITNDIDALCVKMWWQDDFDESKDNVIIGKSHDEWLWAPPSRLFGDNEPSLALEIDKQGQWGNSGFVKRGPLMHPSGVPYTFAEGVQTGLAGDPYFTPTIETKDRLLALAPTEEQREIFIKYCSDYVMVHALSEPITDTIVDDVIFDAIVSVDDDKAEAFETIWASAFQRFRRDNLMTSALSKLAVAHVTRPVS